MRPSAADRASLTPPSSPTWMDPPQQLAAPRPDERKDETGAGKKAAMFTWALVSNTATQK